MLMDVLIRRAALRMDRVDMHRTASWNCGWQNFWRRAGRWLR